MKQNKYPIESVVPHEHPMILIDELLQYDDIKAICKVTIGEHSNFYDPQLKAVPSYVAIEYMAQTIAAYANANKLDLGETVALGFLVSSRKFKVHTAEFVEGTELMITVEQLYREDSGLAAFDCQVKHQQTLVAEAKINIFQPQNAEEFLAEQV